MPTAVVTGIRGDSKKGMNKYYEENRKVLPKRAPGRCWRWTRLDVVPRRPSPGVRMRSLSESTDLLSAEEISHSTFVQESTSLQDF